MATCPSRETTVSDDNWFFREATLRICGDLQLEHALHSTLLFLREQIPADHIFLNFYDTGIAAYRTVAKADLRNGQAVNLVAPMTPEARDKIRHSTAEYHHGNVIIDSAQTNPACAEMLRFHAIDGSSVLRMTLTTNEGRLSSVVLTALGEGRYDEDHAALFGLLARPFAIALTNAMHHRELIGLRDRLSDDEASHVPGLDDGSQQVASDDKLVWGEATDVDLELLGRHG